MRPVQPKLQKPEHEAAFRGRQIIGLLILGGLILTAALLRANWGDLLPTGWWHVW